MFYKGGGAYQEVIDVFGQGILGTNGEIDRSRLGQIVFSDQYALKKLEDIIHPLVRKSTSSLIKKVPFKYIVIEAIKLLESSLAKQCRSIWTSFSESDLQLERLICTRAMDKEYAQQRIRAQPPQHQKTQAADIVIENNGSYSEIWRQVKSAFLEIIRVHGPGEPAATPAYDQIQFIRCTPDDLDLITRLIPKFGPDDLQVDPQNILVEMADKAYLILHEDVQQIGIIRWKLNSFTSIIDQFYIDPACHNPGFMGKIIRTLDIYLTRRLAEVNMLLLPEPMGPSAEILARFDYRETKPEEITTPAWREAVNRQIANHQTIWMKEFTPGVSPERTSGN
jgi:dephospho-CoA kinase